MNGEPRSFTLEHAGLASAIISDVRISSAGEVNPQIHDFKAIWDTGATNSCITQKAAQEIGLIATGMIKMGTAGGSRECPTYYVDLFLPNLVRIPSITVNEVSDLTHDQNDRIEVLIGMDVIMHGDCAITNKGGKTVFTFRIPSITSIDFVKESNSRALKNIGRNNLCPCGSGKKYKHCHMDEHKANSR